MAYVGLGLVHAKVWAVPLLVVYGAFAACTDGVGKAWVSSLAPAEVQGATQACGLAWPGAPPAWYHC